MLGPATTATNLSPKLQSRPSELRSTTMVVFRKRPTAGPMLALQGALIAVLLLITVPPPLARAATPPRQSKKITPPPRELAAVKRRATLADATGDRLVYHGGPVLNVPQVF